MNNTKESLQKQVCKHEEKTDIQALKGLLTFLPFKGKGDIIEKKSLRQLQRELKQTSIADEEHASNLVKEFKTCFGKLKNSEAMPLKLARYKTPRGIRLYWRTGFSKGQSALTLTSDLGRLKIQKCRPSIKLLYLNLDREVAALNARSATTNILTRIINDYLMHFENINALESKLN